MASVDALSFLAYGGGALLWAWAATLLTVCGIAIYREIGRNDRD